MTFYEWILFFVIAICSIITGISVFKWWDWSREANENLDLYLKEKKALDVVKAELDKKNEELEAIKEFGRVVKIERFYSQPKEIECRFLTPQMFVEDTETFKKIVISETARYIAEEIEKDPYLCKVFHSVNAFDCRESISVRMRMLPYAEGVVWEDLFKKEKK